MADEFRPVGPVPRLQPEVPGEAVPGGLENLWQASKLTATGSILRYLSQAQNYEPVNGYNPFTDPVVLNLMPHYGDEFVGSQSPGESLSIARRIEESKGIRHNLERGGAFWSLFGAELFDPINYLPFPIVPRGIGFWKGAARLGAAGAAQELAYQGILEGTDPLHTWEDVAYAVPAATLFAGTLGGLIGRMPDDLAARVARETEDSARRYEAGIRQGTEMPPTEAGEVLPGVDIKVGNTGRYSPTGEYIAGTTARNEDGSRTILIDEEHIRNVYWPQKAWTQPRPYADGTMSEPLKLNDITSPEELVQFIREHELAHVRLAQQEGEGRAAYETRINNEALRVMKEGRAPDKPGGFFAKVENNAQARQRLEELKDGELAEVERKLTEAQAKLDSYPDNAGGRITKAQRKVEALTAQATRLNQRVEQLGKAIADEEAALAAVPPEGAVDASRLSSTGIGLEKMRWHQMPWYLGKNNKFWSWGLRELGKTVSIVMDRLAMAPGQFSIGNMDGVATKVAVEAKSKQWFWAQRQANRAAWSEYFKYLGVPVSENVERQALFHRAGEATRRLGTKVGLADRVAPVSGKMTWEEFVNASGKYHIDGDLTRLQEDARQFVEAATRAYDDMVFVPMGDLGKELKVFYSDRHGASKLDLMVQRVKLWEEKMQAVAAKKAELARLLAGDLPAEPQDVSRLLAEIATKRAEAVGLRATKTIEVPAEKKMVKGVEAATEEDVSLWWNTASRWLGPDKFTALDTKRILRNELGIEMPDRMKQWDRLTDEEKKNVRDAFDYWSERVGQETVGATPATRSSLPAINARLDAIAKEKDAIKGTKEERLLKTWVTEGEVLPEEKTKDLFEAIETKILSGPNTFTLMAQVSAASSKLDATPSQITNSAKAFFVRRLFKLKDNLSRNKADPIIKSIRDKQDPLDFGDGGLWTTVKQLEDDLLKEANLKEPKDYNDEIKKLLTLRSDILLRENASRPVVEREVELASARTDVIEPTEEALARASRLEADADVVESSLRTPRQPGPTNVAEEKMALYWRYRIANDKVFAESLREQGLDIETMMAEHRKLLQQALDSASREEELRAALKTLLGEKDVSADEVHAIVSQQALAAYTYSPETTRNLIATKRQKAAEWAEMGKASPGAARVAELITIEADMFEDILKTREKFAPMFKVTEEQVDSWLRARTVGLKAQEDVINERWLEASEAADHMTSLQERHKVAQWKDGKYHHRVWDWAKIQANRDEFRRILTNWFTQSPNVWINGRLVPLSTDAAAIATRVDEAIETIMKEVELDDPLRALGLMDQERIRHLEIRRQEVLDQLAGAREEVKPYFETKLKLLDDYIASIRQGKVSGPSPIMSRRLDIPDEMVKDFVVTNMDELSQRYVFRMGAHLEMAREFGDAHMTSWFDEFEQQALEAIDGMMDVDQVVRMVDEMKLQRQAVRDVRDKVLGVYGISQNPDAWTERGARFLMNWSALTMMGKAWQAALMDFGRVIQSEGLARSLGSLWRMMAGAERVAYQAGRVEVEQAGLAADLVNAQRMMSIADLGNSAFHKTAFEAGVAKLVPTMFIMNGLSLWTDVVKRFSGTLIQSRIIEDSIRWADGTIDAQAKRRLARAGVDERMARQFAEQWYLAGQQKHGSLYLASTMSWTDPELQRQFRGILANDVEAAVITPGAADRPNFMSDPHWAMILQYKGFSMAATQRILMSGLQQRDKLFLQGVASMVAIAWLVESSFRSHEWDRPPVHQQLYNAVERSGVGGIFLDMNQILETASGGELGIRPALGLDPILREPSPAQRLGALAGPAASQWSQAFWAFTSDDATTNQQAKALRYLLPFNNLWLVGDHFSRAQHELADSLHDPWSN